jgi:energy-coupling factor transporter ATP-binding protein EcfA2
MSKLKVQFIKSSKDEIKKPQECIDYAIPDVLSSLCIIGSSGSGKTTVLTHLVNTFYKDFYDEIYLISPTSQSDDVQKAMNLKKENVFNDVEKGLDFIQKIMDANRKLIENPKITNAKAPTFLCIYDDIIAYKEVLNSKTFKLQFIGPRHYNSGTIVLSQTFKQIPKYARLQASIILFQSNLENNMEMADIYTPPHMSKKDFLSIIQDATKEKYNFLFINNKAPVEIRYRKNFEHIYK